MKAFFLLSLAAIATCSAQIKTTPIEYQIEGKNYAGLLATPQQTDEKTLPGILVVHDWTGHNAFAREQAEMLAKLGYIGFAVDLYGKGTAAANPEEAGKLAAPFYADRSLFRTRMAAALEVLKKQPGVDPKRLGAIGFCFGGTAVLELARMGADVKGVASFHGGLKPGDPADASAVKCEVLVLHGNSDPHVPPADVEAFMDEMNAANVAYKFVGYPRAVHAFTNPAAGNDPSKGAAFSPEVAKAAFGEMRRFFSELFHSESTLPPDTAMR